MRLRGTTGLLFNSSERFLRYCFFAAKVLGCGVVSTACRIQLHSVWSKRYCDHFSTEQGTVT